MNVFSQNMGTISNVGNLDRLIRFIIGAVLIAVTLTFTDINNQYVLFAALVAIPIIGTVIVAWCPMYALLNISSAHSQHFQSFFAENIGTIDALMRFCLGSMLVVYTLINASIESPWKSIVALFSIPIIASGIIRWDPAYAFLIVSTRGRQNVEKNSTNEQKLNKMDQLLDNSTSSRKLKAA